MSRASSALLRLALILALGATVVTAAGLLVAPQLGSLRNVAEATAGDLVLQDLNQRSNVYAMDGTLIATLREEENREPVSLDRVPSHVIDAVLASEDADFYSHKGVNARATLRALFSNVESGEVSQGGSTITQQLVKKSLLDSTQALSRKSKEAFLALRLEQQLSKDEILERYLNTIYLGNHSYGIQAAAETYFGVEVEDLDIAQAAMLASLIRNPVNYDPFLYPDVALERRRIALRRMVIEGHITDDEAKAAVLQPLPASPSDYTPPPDDYFVEEVKQQLLEDPRLGATQTERFDAVFRGGLEIYTTIDLGAQYLAEVARNDVLAPFAQDENPALFLAGKNPTTGEDEIGTVAMASVEPGTGAVRAMVGGPGFGDDYKFNLATQGYRQPGSAMKTFVLLTLLEQGYSPADRISGVGPCTFKVPGQRDLYTVNNFSNSNGFTGTITSMTTASSNCGYVRLGQVAGIDEVVELAGELGLETRNDRGEIVELDPEIFSTPLGTQGVTPLAMASAYATIANNGYHNPPYLVEEVRDRNGKRIFAHTDEGFRAFSIETAQLAADILKDNVVGGTGTAARVRGHDIGGKTGTAQDFSNGWFVGFSRELATSVWMGAIDTNVPMRSVGGRSVTGGSYPARIFGQYMSEYLDGAPPKDFAPAPRRPSSSRELEVDRAIDVTRTTRATTPSPPSRPSSTATTKPDEGGDDDDAPATTAPVVTTEPGVTPTTGDLIP